MKSHGLNIFTITLMVTLLVFSLYIFQDNRASAVQIGNTESIDDPQPSNAQQVTIPVVPPVRETPNEQVEAHTKEPVEPTTSKKPGGYKNLEHAGTTIQHAISSSHNDLLLDTAAFNRKQKLVEHVMNFSDDSGMTNAIVGAAYLNGAIVEPGDVFSFNAVVGERTSNRGFTTGISIINGEKVPDIGGGVCRLSTVLHQTVEQAGFEIIEHHRHTLPVSYGNGNDAAVSWPDTDYKFKNTLEQPIQIEVIVNRKSIQVAFWQLD